MMPPQKNIRWFGVISVIQLLLLSFQIPAGLRAHEIHQAAMAGDLNKVQAMLETDPRLLESTDEQGNTPLLAACFKKQAAVANFLIAKGANINAKGNADRTPLSCASRGSDIELVRRLIAKGANVNAREALGYSPLSIAIGGDLNIAKLLLENGADPNASDWTGPILHQAVKSGRREKVELLLKNGAKINQRNTSGQNEIHVAAIRDKVDMVRLLLSHGVEVDALDSQGRTALYYAAKHGLRGVANALIAGGAKESTIIEHNFGQAKQLTTPLESAEAYLWSLGEDGYAVKTKGHLLLIDPQGAINDSPEAGLANGALNPNELAGQKITVLITAPAPNEDREVQPNLRIFELAKRVADVDFVVSFKPEAKVLVQGSAPAYRLAVHHENLPVGDLMVHTIPATRAGVAYLVEVDGLKIFYAGYHVCNAASQQEGYRKEIDFLKSFGPVDIVFLPTMGHLIPTRFTYDSYLYLIDQLSPKTVYLFHDRAMFYADCAQFLCARKTRVAYPETVSGMRGGDRFHFRREQNSD